MSEVLREKEVTTQGIKTIMPNSKAIDKDSKSLLYGYDNMARSIQEFMYEGRPGRSPKKNHTEAEYRKFLEGMMKRCWENYNQGAKSLSAKQNRKDY